MSAPAALAAETAQESTDKASRGIAIVCAIIAGTVHAIVAPEHLAEAWYVGTFFLVVCVAQLALVPPLRATTPVTGFLVGAIGLNLGIVVLYVASRTVGLPFLPSHEHGAHTVEHLPVAGAIGNGVPVFPVTDIEPVGPLDLVCLGAELILIVMLVGLLRGRARHAVINVIMGMGLLALAARALGLLA